MNSFDLIRERLLGVEFLNQLARTGLSIEDARNKVLHSVEEAIHTFELIDQPDLKSKRILEAGAGLGVLACYLNARGYHVCVLEPGENGFEENRNAAQFLRTEFKANYPIFDCAIEDLSVEQHGYFDLIVSNNVLEHVACPISALESLGKVLDSRGGAMVHNCPNYAVPYEPHYRILLVPFFPKLTRYFLPAAVLGDACWQSLNFISHQTVIRAAKQMNFEVAFKRGLMHEALERLEKDPLFAERQSGLPKRIHHFLEKWGLLEAVKYLPYQLSTPMVFTMRRRLDTI
jgi:2-polyprenyl-3-methyl-5-hydroxy-6-metoxy-1,4-benzoquinol methylase